MKSVLSFFLWLAVILLTKFQLLAQKPISANGKFTTVKGVKLYYEDTGKGMPLLLLHGFNMTAAGWDPFISEFSKNNRVIALDLPGHGRSDWMDTSDIYLHKKAAEYIIGLLDNLGIDSINVMGISSGGFITLYMATLRPQLTKRIVIIGGQVYYSRTTRDVITAFANPDSLSQAQKENVNKAHGTQKASLLARQFWNFRKLYGDPSFTPDVLSTIKAKTLIIHGDNDRIAPAVNAWEMFQYIPQARLWIVPNGGHVPVLVPANQSDFIRRSLEFLQDKF